MSDGPGARLLGSTHYLASRTEHVSHVVPVPVPGPPARVITPLGMTRWQLPGPAPRPPKRRKIPAAAAAVRIVADLPRQKVYVKHHPFECTEGCGHDRFTDVQHCVTSRLHFAGYGSWKTQWSHEHQRYCCYKFKESCTTKAGISRKISWLGVATPKLGCVSC